MRSALLRVVALATVAMLAAGCDSSGSREQVAIPADAMLAHDHDGGTPTTSFSPDVNRELAALRRLVAPYHNFDRATAAGWTVPATPCLESPAGGMGFHFGNPAYINDGGEVAVLEPELLLFEPQANGNLRFVGVEYIVLFSDHGPDLPPPTLFGMPFHAVTGAGLWGLHAWVGRHNPDGMFADWNPLVSCEHASPP
jgi:hypothetical protein